MRLDPEHAHELLTRIDPGRVRSGQAIGLRDGALLALVAAGLSAVEIATLRASAVTMTSGKLLVGVRRHGLTWFVVLPTDFGARLIAWLTECRLWAAPEPVFRGSRGPLTSMGICKVLERYRNHHQVPCAGAQKFRRSVNRAWNYDMISLAECRKILGEAARGLSDAELERLRQELYGLADITVTCFLNKKNGATTHPAKEPSG